VAEDLLAEAVIAGAPAREIAGIPLPGSFAAACLHAEDVKMFDGTDKDVRKSIHISQVAMPEIAPDEVLVATMASALNYNTVWSATFEPVPTFVFLRKYARQGGWAARHDLPYHILGSDGAGVVVRAGSGVRRWKIGDHVIIHPGYVDEEEPATHSDAVLGEEQRAWGFETNFGGLSQYCVVRASQLLPKPAHLTWEEAASNSLCAGTAYRMLVSDKGARMKQGDVALIWGASGGLGGYATQLVKNGGGTPVGVVGSQAHADAARRLGCEHVIDRRDVGLDGDPSDDPEQVIDIGRRLGKDIRSRVGRDPDIIFEHVGRATFGVSLFVAARGGTVVTCGSSTGYQHTYDNRYLWMRLKKVIGSHGANLREQWESTRLIESGAVVPTVSAVYPLEETGQAAHLLQSNSHVGKVAVLCLAPGEGLGVTDPERRFAIGAQRLNPLRAVS
jgi:crotonyl-CoA reductase